MDAPRGCGPGRAAHIRARFGGWSYLLEFAVCRADANCWGVVCPRISDSSIAGSCDCAEVVRLRSMFTVAVGAALLIESTCAICGDVCDLADADSVVAMLIGYCPAVAMSAAEELDSKNFIHATTAFVLFGSLCFAAPQALSESVTIDPAFSLPLPLVGAAATFTADESFICDWMELMSQGPSMTVAERPARKSADAAA